MKKRILIGHGRFGWNSVERVSDRYGAIMLFDSSNDVIPFMNSESLSGNGKLIVKINKIRKSFHIGDLFRGLYPTQPSINEEIVLGEGKIFFDNFAVGLKPKDNRKTDWLNPKMLYRAHDQEVSLYFDRK